MNGEVEKLVKGKAILADGKELECNVIMLLGRRVERLTWPSGLAQPYKAGVSKSGSAWAAPELRISMTSLVFSHLGALEIALLILSQRPVRFSDVFGRDVGVVRFYQGWWVNGDPLLPAHLALD